MNDETRQNPYAPPEARVTDFTEGGGAGDRAGRFVRLGAALIDFFLFTLAYAPLILAAGTPLAALETQTYVQPLGAVTVVLWAALALGTSLLVHRKGQTIGKWLVDIKVVRSDGSRASLGRIFWLRNVVNGVPAPIPVLGIVYVIFDHLFIFGERRQCIHDLIADTIVVNS